MAIPRWAPATALAVLLAAAPAAAIVPAAKPLDQLAGEVAAFLVSDVGIGGIRTNDGAPDGYPVPPYFYHYAIKDSNHLWSCGPGYPGYCAVSYPAYTASVAIDAFLAMRVWNGDPEMLARARQFADWILEHRTPAGDLYAHFPYSTQTEGVMGGGWDGPAVMTDKPAIFAVRLLHLYDITGEAAYWQGAQEIADVLAETQLAGSVEDDGRWPWRVVPSDGTVTQDYTSHLQPAVQLFDAMAARTGNPAYAGARDRAWQWLLLNPCNPASVSYQRWEAFYEDQSPEMQLGKRDHYSAHEMIGELVRRRPPGWGATAVAILDTASARFLQAGPGTDYGIYEPVTLEWEGWPEATYAASLQYAHASLLLHAALTGDPLQDDAWRVRALHMVDVCTHGQNDRGIAADGRMFTSIRDLLFLFNIDSWYEQNFNTVKYALAIMGLIPELAPSGETHVLTADRALTAIAYGQGGWAVAYATAGGGGRETLRLAAPPSQVLAGGQVLPQLASPDHPGPGWHWNGLRALLTVIHETSPVQVRLDATAVEVPAAAATLAAAVPNPFNPRTTLVFTLSEARVCRLAVYSPAGRLVRSLADGERGVGRHAVEWDGRDDGGRRAAAGCYIVRLAAGNATLARRVVMVK